LQAASYSKLPDKRILNDPNIFLIYPNIPKGWFDPFLPSISGIGGMPTGSATAQEQQLVPERGPKGPQGRTGKSSHTNLAKCHEKWLKKT